MPCSCLSPQTDDETQALHRSRVIDKDLKQEGKRRRGDVKLLLLGAGASGKSTFVRQMRIIHGGGFSADERQYMRTIIYENVVDCAKSLATAMESLELQYETEERRNLGERIRNLNAEKVSDATTFTGISDWIAEFWSDAGVQACYQRRTEFELLDSCAYYMDECNRLAASDYIPSEMDIIRSRSPTLSILVYPFELDEMTYHIVDVGGQKTERRKWMFCFEGVTSVIFLAALSEYTRSAEEGNALVESQLLLAAVMRSPYLFKTSFILFLNKNDIFEEKIRQHHLHDYIPSYTGPIHDADAAYNHIEEMFLDGVPEERVQLKQRKEEESMAVVQEEPLIYCHRTTATNTDNIRRIFSAVRDTIIENFLIKINIV